MPDGSLDVCGRERPDGQAHQGTLRRDPPAARRRAAEAAIRRATGLDRRTSAAVARAASAGELLAGVSRESKLDEFKPYICQRVEPGPHRRRPDHASSGSAAGPAARRPSAGTSPAPAGRAGRHARPAVPKTREITAVCCHAPAASTTATRPGFAAVRAGCPHWTPLARHIRDFAEMMTRRQGLLALEDWLTRVEADDQPELHSLAAGIRRDQEAVTAGPGPALPLRRHGRKRQQDDQAPDARPRRLRLLLLD